MEAFRNHHTEISDLEARIQRLEESYKAMKTDIALIFHPVSKDVFGE